LHSLDEHHDAISLARCTMPPRAEGEPLFREPWHARIFAVIVALVKDRKLEWNAFQTRLVSELKAHQSPDAQLTLEEVDLQYFDCWLDAAEETLDDAGFLTGSDIAAQIETIRSVISEIRLGQLRPRA